MATEVDLVPTMDYSLWGAHAESFSTWSLVNSSLFTFLDKDGLLEKKRGVLRIVVKRPFSQYVSTVFLPSNLLLCMTCTSLWLPLAVPFTMPRVALNAIALLSQVTLA